MNNEQRHSEGSMPLDEEDLKFCQRLAKLLALAGFDTTSIEKIMAEVKAPEHIDYLLEYLADIARERHEFIEQLREQHKSFSQVSAAVAAMQTASGLSDEAAKTCVYYAAATYGLDQLQLFPILVFQGSFSTGKSDAMKVLKQLVNRPIEPGTTLSRASLRDELGKTQNSTIFIEEADGIAEDIISNRYSRETAKTSVKRATLTGWIDTEVTYFGATVLHKRRPFNDPATASRTLLVKTRHKPGNYYVPEVGQEVRDGLKQLWDDSNKEPITLEHTGRAADVWKPLITVAEACTDVDWLMYSLGEVKKAEDKLKLGQEFDPEEQIVNALIALSSNERVTLPAIREELRREYNWQPSAWAIAEMVRESGFEITTSGGQRKVIIDKEKLAQVAQELGIEDTGLGE